ncbi:hypothetical protein Fmac_031479 [Flemingia macrophylla]|uniref:Uncharacterized protein n=1 Tax=Flemingia macrophylla TaxID=520843 RepID=A0ABD1L2N8_9FABA
MEKGLPRFLCGATMADLDGKLLHDIYDSHVCILNCELFEALYVAEQKAREAVAMRSKVQKEKEDAT